MRCDGDDVDKEKVISTLCAGGEKLLGYRFALLPYMYVLYCKLIWGLPNRVLWAPVGSCSGFSGFSGFSAQCSASTCFLKCRKPEP